MLNESAAVPSPEPDTLALADLALLAQVHVDDVDDEEDELTGVAESVEYVHRSWPADPNRLSVIRHELRRWLAPLDLSENETDDVVLAVDEAAANAVRHAYPSDRPGNVELTLWTEGTADGGALCIEITDHGSWRPTETVTADTRGGRGMLLMQHMVETVLVHFDARGSRVLLRHRFTSPPAA
ncbi:ATP-binding protein [Pseudonocardia pini]|uniref:ATP-binding protein n=1 Tax=Pseudonocardia pini TaxID=2758030 RepID=UPI0015F11C36|nr:ATP-binding protein [Pseudonocardia pini]